MEKRAVNSIKCRCCGKPFERVGVEIVTQEFIEVNWDTKFNMSELNTDEGDYISESATMYNIYCPECNKYLQKDVKVVNLLEKRGGPRKRKLVDEEVSDLAYKFYCVFCDLSEEDE